MKYEFPKISNINDVLPHIKDRNEFIVAEKDDYAVINYLVDLPNTFSRDEEGWEIRRECRGLIFDKSGMIISRPLHKFANIDQWPETRLDTLDFSKIKNIMVKEDGSFIRPFFVNNELRWGTKMGHGSDVAVKAANFVKGKVSAGDNSLVDFAASCLISGISPVFEYVAPHNRIVIEYQEEKFILLAMRNMYTGKYLDIWDDIQVKRFGIETVERKEFSDTLVSDVRALQDSEGVVIEFDGGFRVKLKAEKYVQLHRIFDELSKDRHIVASVIDGTLDDIIPSLDASKLKLVNDVTDEFRADYNNAFNRIYGEIVYAQQNFDGDAKRIALEFVPSIHKKDAKFVFSAVKGNFGAKEIGDMIKDTIRQATTKETAWEEIKEWMKHGIA